MSICTVSQIISNSSQLVMNDLLHTLVMILSGCLIETFRNDIYLGSESDDKILNKFQEDIMMLSYRTTMRYPDNYS